MRKTRQIKLTTLLGLLSKAFQNSGDIVVLFALAGRLFSVLRLIQLDDAIVVAFVLYALAFALHIMEQKLEREI